MIVAMESQQKIDKTDVNQVVNDHQLKLKNFIRSRVSNQAEAEDILQDVFLQLVKTVEDSVNPIEQVSAWLYRVAKNIIINKGKKKKETLLSSNDDDEAGIMQNFAEILFSADVATPEMEYMRSLVWEELDRALQELPTEQREVFVMMEMEGLSAKDIAEVLSISVNTVLSRKHYAIKYLRFCMKDLYYDLLDV